MKLVELRRMCMSFYASHAEYPKHLKVPSGEGYYELLADCGHGEFWFGLDGVETIMGMTVERIEGEEASVS
jgi:hypothetical protein